MLEPAGDEACVWETGSDSLGDLAAFITRLDVPFTVESPPELQTHFRNLAARYTAAARTDPGRPITD